MNQIHVYIEFELEHPVYDISRFDRDYGQGHRVLMTTSEANRIEKAMKEFMECQRLIREKLKK